MCSVVYTFFHFPVGMSTTATLKETIAKGASSYVAGGSLLPSGTSNVHGFAGRDIVADPAYYARRLRFLVFDVVSQAVSSIMLLVLVATPPLAQTLRRSFHAVPSMQVGASLISPNILDCLIKICLVLRCKQ